MYLFTKCFLWFLTSLKTRGMGPPFALKTHERCFRADRAEPRLRVSWGPCHRLLCFAVDLSWAQFWEASVSAKKKKRSTMEFMLIVEKWENVYNLKENTPQIPSPSHQPHGFLYASNVYRHMPVCTLLVLLICLLKRKWGHIYVLFFMNPFLLNNVS